MAYQVLARKWRPKTFADLVGQEHVVKALRNALDEGRLHHAYLLTGTRGVGKTTIARILAKSLNCENAQHGEPCGVCQSCTQIDTGRYVDLLEIDAASNTGIDNIREGMGNATYQLGQALNAGAIRLQDWMSIEKSAGMAGKLYKDAFIETSRELGTGVDKAIAKNGDTANKIGTYALAIAASYHRIPFYVAAPFSTFDFNISSGDYIIIEERSDDEIKKIGTEWIAPAEISTFNPAFDITPHHLITAIITESGVIYHPNIETVTTYENALIKK